MNYSIVDADGHVIETNEGVAKYLDEPFRRRPLTFTFYPQDGWDRRLLGTLGDQGGTVRLCDAEDGRNGPHVGSAVVAQAIGYRGVVSTPAPSRCSSGSPRP